MDKYIPIIMGYGVRITDGVQKNGDYATSMLPKGLLLENDGQCLTEEAVGFGFPVIMRGLQTIFPRITYLKLFEQDPDYLLTVDFTLDREENISARRFGRITDRHFYQIKNYLAKLIRRVPLARNILTGISSILRRLFGWKSVYIPAAFSRVMKVKYMIHRGRPQIQIEFDAHDLVGTDVTEVVVMNEQGAHFFDRYQDSSGLNLVGKMIGCWDPVLAEEAWFESPTRHLAFGLRQVEGAKMFRGRELVGSRLAWSGFGYSFEPGINVFSYELTLKKLP